MKNVQIFYNCAFCKVGILVCQTKLEETGREHPHILFPRVVVPQSSTIVLPSFTLLLLFWQKLTFVLLFISTQACSPFQLLGTTPFLTQPLFFLRHQKYER